MLFSPEIKESPTLLLGEKARQKKEKGEKVISLAVGEPDFPTPEYIIDATKRLMKDIRSIPLRKGY